MSIQVIGAGFGRTGTKSLQLALEKIGFQKCYHMEELFRNPEGVKHWKNAYLEKPVAWDNLLQNYNAIVDFPGSIYYKSLADHYPNAKVILTVRDPKKWHASALSTIYSFDPGPKLKLKMLLKMPFSSKARNLFKAIMLNNKSLWDKYFEGKFEDEKYCIKKFNAHIEEVKKYIAPERLLIFESKDGWEPLCDFLNKPIPNEDYPSANKKENFNTWAIGIVNDVI